MTEIDLAKSVNKEVYICTSCGGNLTYDITTQKLKCPYCDTEVEIERNMEVKEYDFTTVEDDELNSEWNNEVEVIKCDSCGATTIVEKNQVALECAYCNSSHVLVEKQSAGIKPEGIMPFKIDKYQAQSISEKWIKRQWLAPNNLKVLYQNGKLNPIYVPFWTYDSDTHSTYTGQGGEYYYVTVERDGKHYRERRTRWYNVNGVVDLFFDDVVVNASDSFSNALIDSIDRYSTKQLEHYSEKYLSGFTAERYSKGVKSCFDEAKYKMNDAIVDEARRQILRRYDEARSINAYTNYSNVTYKHVLLPVWASTYHYKNKIYKYIINGETGAIDGYAPISPIKVTILVILGLIILGFVLFYMNSGGEAWVSSIINF